MLEILLNMQDNFLIPRIVESLLFLLITIRLYRKFPNQAFNKRPLLHRLFTVGILGWTVYAICDIFIFSFAALSFDTSVPIYVVGYTLEYPSLLIANILRDIACIGQFTQVAVYFFVPDAIFEGEMKTKQKMHNPWVQFIFILCYFVLIISDMISVQITEEFIYVSPNWNGVSGFFLTFTIVFYFIAAIRIQKALSKAKYDVNSREFSKRTSLLSWGIMMMGISFLWALFWNIVGIYYFSLFLFFFVSYSLHLFWMSSPILIYLGLQGDNI